MMTNSATYKTFSGTKYNLTKASDILNLAKKVKTTLKNAHEAVAAALPYAMNLATAAGGGDCNSAPLNALYDALAIKSGESVYQKRMVGYVLVWLNGYDFNKKEGKFKAQGRGEQAKQARFLHEGFDYEADYRLFEMPKDDTFKPVTVDQIVKLGPNIVASMDHYKVEEQPEKRLDLINALLDMVQGTIPADILLARFGINRTPVAGAATALTGTEQGAEILRNDEKAAQGVAV